MYSQKAHSDFLSYMYLYNIISHKERYSKFI